ncbi:zeta toxin family protein (plasmid) [Sphaerotilaceae bacterium SBD11-9]
MSQQASHALPPAEHEATYQAIADYYLPRSEPRQNPRAIVTAGQPGAGKSGLASGAKEELRAQGGYVLIDADKLRVRHRDYQALLHEDDRTAADKTHVDAAAWANRLTREAAQGRRNLIVDQTSRDPAALQQLAANLHQAGYTVELRVMAVNEKVSEQRIHTRYEQQKAVDGYGRFSNPANHAAAYAAVPVTVSTVEAAGAVDRITVYDKDHRVLNDRALQGGRWTGSSVPSADAIHAERTRPLSLQEHAELARGYDKLAEMLKAPDRHATAAEAARIDALRTNASNAWRAEVFKQTPPEVATRAHPELAGAYGILAAIERQTEAQGLVGAAKAAVMERSRSNIAASLSRGEAPTIEVRQGPDRTKGRDHDR